MEKDIDISNICDKVTRFEVIDENGRSYTKYNCSIELSFQDDNRTLKVFVTNNAGNAGMVLKVA